MNIKLYNKWHYMMLLVISIFSIIYSIPNLYGDEPAIQIAFKGAASQDFTSNLKIQFDEWKIQFKSIEPEEKGATVRFADTENQLLARDKVKFWLGEKATVAINLAPVTPQWLRYIGAGPMKLGLDLRGGIHLLLEVDSQSVIENSILSDIKIAKETLAKDHIEIKSIDQDFNGYTVTLNSELARDKAFKELSKSNYKYSYSKAYDNNYIISVKLSDAEKEKLRSYAIDQTITSLNKRVNELGVSEPIVQKQGLNNIAVDLPGIQDIARAKSLIGKTATLSFHIVDNEATNTYRVNSTLKPGTILIRDKYNNPYALHENVVLSGQSITYANNVLNEGRPAVKVDLGGGGEAQFYQETMKNKNKQMAVVYIETKIDKITENGKTQNKVYTNKKIISVATIQSALGNNFVITGLGPYEAEDLALLLRSGAMAAPVKIIQEMTVGPSLGKANIEMGVKSLAIGSLLVILFMAAYYRLFGIIANIALMMNVLLLMALLSIIDMTLTLPGIAGIVLTVGMAVDANVLINERIREELRRGANSLVSINAGYEKAFSTILDANVTTLIVAIILFSLGSGAVKGFAVTIIVGIIASMITSVFFTRAIVYLFYNKSNQKLSIGI